MKSATKAIHTSFVIERHYDASVERVFVAWSNPQSKARWFSGPAEQWTQLERSNDFRVGGQEVLHGKFASGKEGLYRARYHAIVRDQRIVYVYEMTADQVPMPMSLATVELRGERGGTHFVFTEQAVYIDGNDGTVSRKRGAETLIDQFETVLRGACSN